MLGAFWGIAHPALGGGRVAPVGWSTGAFQALADAVALLALSILAKEAPRGGPLDFPYTRFCLGPYTDGLGDPGSLVVDSIHDPSKSERILPSIVKDYPDLIVVDYMCLMLLMVSVLVVAINFF
uniref:Uncharacterized protein n=1 Tax=Arundo donax TaxID=35708 RepID=A0A0A9B1L3_ARUDO